MKPIITALALGLFLALISPLQASPMTDLDSAMAPIAQALIKIDEALAKDSTEGVQAAAKSILTLNAKVHTEGLEGEDGAKLKGLETKIATAAKAIADADTIEAQRSALKDLSKPIALWATLRSPEGIYVAYCPMAKGSWLQDETMISNPYYGASMLRCGQIVKREE